MWGLRAPIVNRLPGRLSSRPPHPRQLWVGTEDDGKILFITYACATCHELDAVPQSKDSSDGPKLAGVGTKGTDYIRESILTPSAEVVEGYEDGLMPQDFATQLSADELDTLVTFLSGQ